MQREHDIPPAKQLLVRVERAGRVRSERLVFPFAERRRLHARAYRAQQDGHRDIVGLLLLRAGSARLSLTFIRNNANAGAWQIARDLLQKTRLAVQDKGWRV